MMDVSLDDLLSGLEAAQKKKSQVKLSDRNVVELITKLRHLGFLGNELLHTSDGREYITRSKLEEEIKNGIDASGGRLPVVELPSLVGVDLVHCENAAQEVVRDSGGEVVLAQGELFANKYFDMVADEIHQELQESGVTTIGDLARRYGVGADMMGNAVANRIGDSKTTEREGKIEKCVSKLPAIKGRLENGVLYTDAYIARLKAQLRGALRGALAPVSLQSLRKSLGISSLGVLSSMIPSLIEELQSEGSIDGKLMSGGGTWIPSIHSKMQQEFILSHYRQNGIVEFDVAARHGISDPKSFFKASFPEGLALSDSFVTPAMMHEMDAAVEEAANGNSWCDVVDSVSTMLSVEDMKALLQYSDLIKSKTSDGSQILADTCFVTKSFIDSIRDVLLSEARILAKETYSKKTVQHPEHKSIEKASNLGTSKSNDTAKGKQSRKQKSKMMSLSEDDDDDIDDDWEMSGGRKGKKVGGKGKKGGANKRNVSSSHKSGKDIKVSNDINPGNSISSSAQQFLSSSALHDKIIELHPELEGAGTDGGLPQAIVSCIKPDIVAEYEKALNDIFTAGANKRKIIRECATKRLETQYKEFQLYKDGIEIFKEDESTSEILQKHLVRTAGARCVDSLLHVLAADIADNVDHDTEASGNTPPEELVARPFSQSQRVSTARESSSETGKPLLSCISAIADSKTSPSDFVAYFEDACSAAGIGLRKLDRKQIIETMKCLEDNLQRQVANSIDAPIILAAAIPLLLIKKRHKCVTLPGKALSAAVEILKDDLSEEEISLLESLHASVVAQLKNVASSNPEGIDNDVSFANDSSLIEKIRTLTA